MLKRALLAVPLTFALALVVAVPADAGVYEGNKCVSGKIKEAGKLCKAYMKAWSKWDQKQDDVARDASLAKAESKFLAKWAKADTKALGKGVDCADTTIDAATAEGLVDAAVIAVKDDVNAGLTLAPAGSADGKCGGKLLGEASKKCDGILKNYSKFIKNPAKDPQRTKLNEKTGKVDGKFGEKFQKVLDDGCPSGATVASAGTTIDTLRDDVRTGTTISPNVSDNMFDTITHPGPGESGHEIQYEGEALRPRCQSSATLDLARYSYFVKRGTENKLLMYYQGGGTCWSGVTCCSNFCDQDVDESGSDNPNNGFQTGFGDLSNPSNPFRNWHVVFVSYCSCDIHTGDNEHTYGGTNDSGPVCGALQAGVQTKSVNHRGYVNAKLAEKFAREHFLDPEEVYVTGSSAGAFGALTHIAPMARIYAASNVNMLTDAGTFIPSQSFIDNAFTTWGLVDNFEKLNVPGIDLATITSPGILEDSLVAYSNEFPDVNFGQFIASFDGGSGGLGSFYHAMINHTYNPGPTITEALELANWWESICDYHNDVTEVQPSGIEAAVSSGNDNYRYYIASGGRHTMFGSNKVYDDNLGGVEPVVDFINKQRIKPTDPSWTNQLASPRNILHKACGFGGSNMGESCLAHADCATPNVCSGGTNAGEPCPGGLGDCPDQGAGTACVGACVTDDPTPTPGPETCPFELDPNDPEVGYRINCGLVCP